MAKRFNFEANQKNRIFGKAQFGQVLIFKEQIHGLAKIVHRLVKGLALGHDMNLVACRHESIFASADKRVNRPLHDKSVT